MLFRYPVLCFASLFSRMTLSWKQKSALNDGGTGEKLGTEVAPILKPIASHRTHSAPTAKLPTGQGRSSSQAENPPHNEIDSIELVVNKLQNAEDCTRSAPTLSMQPKLPIDLKSQKREARSLLIGNAPSTSYINKMHVSFLGLPYHLPHTPNNQNTESFGEHFLAGEVSGKFMPKQSYLSELTAENAPQARDITVIIETGCSLNGQTSQCEQKNLNPEKNRLGISNCEHASDSIPGP